MDAEKWRGEGTMVRLKQSEDMGESTSPQRIQLEDIVLKDKNDGKEMETDNGLQASASHLPVSPPFLSVTYNSYIKCAQKTEVNAGHGGFSALDMYWFLLCSFIKLLLSHSPEAAHSLTLSQTHCHIDTATCLGGCSGSSEAQQSSFFSISHMQKRRGGGSLGHAVNTEHVLVWSCISCS